MSLDAPKGVVGRVLGLLHTNARGGQRRLGSHEFARALEIASVKGIFLELFQRVYYSRQSHAYIREAVAEKLSEMGIAVPDRLIHPPPRAQVVQVHSGVGNNYSLNEPPGKYPAKKKRKK